MRLPYSITLVIPFFIGVAHPANFVGGAGAYDNVATDGVAIVDDDDAGVAVVVGGGDGAAGVVEVAAGVTAADDSVVSSINGSSRGWAPFHIVGLRTVIWESGIYRPGDLIALGFVEDGVEQENVASSIPGISRISPFSD